MKKVAAITMVRNDNFFLEKWVKYYGRELGKENLYIFFDGMDQEVATFCDGTHVELREKSQGQLIATDKDRIGFLSQKAAELLSQGYDIIIGVDVDEFLVVDPRRGLSLREYLEKAKIRTSISGLGLDFGRKEEEDNLTSEATILSQRHYAQIGTRYTKPSVITRPCHWGSGFHRIKGHNFHIGKDLYLLHFGYCDKLSLDNRFSDKGRLEQGWEKHMKKRSRTLSYAMTLPAKDFDTWTTLGRICQTLCRPPYALNKPAMFERHIVVRIPERFENII